MSITSDRGVLRNLLRAAALAAALGGAGCGSDASRLEGHMKRAEKYMAEEKYAEAVIEFKNALQIDPNQSKAHYGLAKSYLGSKQAQRAFWELQETVRLDPSHLDARLEYAQFLLLGKASDLRAAIDQADQVLAQQSDSMAALLLKGRALQSLERYDEAQSVFELALERNPEEAAPILLLAAFHRARGENARAEELLRKLTELKPSFGSFAALAGFLSADRARDADTEALFEQALERAEASEKPSAHAALANFYYSRERYDSAETTLKQGLEQSPGDLDLVYTLARFYHGRGDTAHADEMIQRATQAKPDDPKPFLVLSAYRGRNGDIEGALAATDDALKAAPDDLSARLRRAELLVDIGYQAKDEAKIAEGRAAVTEVLARDAANPEALFVQSKIDVTAGQLDAAVNGLRRALDQRPEWPQAHLLLGSTLFLKKDLQGARAELSRTLELDASLTEAAKLLARVHAALGDDDLALEVGRKALATSEDPKLRIVLAQSLARERKLDQAVRELEAVPEEQRDAEAWYALGRVELLRGKTDAGRERLMRAYALDPTRYEVLRALLDLDVKQEKLAESVARIDAALEAKPDDPKLLQLGGEIALYSGDHTRAEGYFQKAIQKDPNDVSAYEKLARFLMVSGRPDEVVKTYETALERNPDSAPLNLIVGSLYELRGRTSDAIARYEDSVRLDPSLAVAKNNLAYLLAESGGNLDRALDLAKQAKELLPDNANTADTLGWVLYKKHSPDAAVGYLREAVRNMQPDDPQLPIVRQHLALAYEAAGDLTSAREAVDQALADIQARKIRDGEESSPEPIWAGEIRALRERLAKAGP